MLADSPDLQESSLRDEALCGRELVTGHDIIALTSAHFTRSGLHAYHRVSVCVCYRSDWVSSYKVLLSNDSHSWVTLKNGSRDVVRLSKPNTFTFSLFFIVFIFLV